MPTEEVDRAIVMLCNMAKNDDPFIRPRLAQLHTLIVPPLSFVLVREIIEFHQTVEGVSTVPWELVLGIMPSIFAFGDSDSD